MLQISNDKCDSRVTNYNYDPEKSVILNHEFKLINAMLKCEQRLQQPRNRWTSKQNWNNEQQGVGYFTYNVEI